MAVAFVAGAIGVTTWLAVLRAAVTASVSALLMVRWQARVHVSANRTTPALFPSPS